MRLVLASASPRRRELLALAGFSFEVRVSGIDEARREGELPVDYVRRLAVEKASSVARELGAKQEMQIPPLRRGMTTKGPEPSTEYETSFAVLGADTTVVLDGEVMNKPRDRAEAERMLRALSGRTHQVHTGVAAVCSRCALSHVETTDVVFREIGKAELAAYLDSGDPMDKAGAYGIQGYAARWIPRIAGDYFNVVGLPIAAVVGLLDACERGRRR